MQEEIELERLESPFKVDKTAMYLIVGAGIALFSYMFFRYMNRQPSVEMMMKMLQANQYNHQPNYQNYQYPKLTELSRVKLFEEKTKLNELQQQTNSNKELGSSDRDLKSKSQYELYKQNEQNEQNSGIGYRPKVTAASPLKQENMENLTMGRLFGML